MQIAKLLIIPFVCGVESVWLGKVFSRSIIASIFTVVAGVAIVYAPSPDCSIICACSVCTQPPWRDTCTGLYAQ